MSELVTEYLERAAPARRRLDMWWHLCRCPACRHYFDQVRRTVRLLGSGRAAPPDRQTEDSVVAAVQGEPPRDP